MTEDVYNVDLDNLLGRVSDERSFIAFVEALACDFAKEQAMVAETRSDAYGPGPRGWENGTVDAVLGAAAAWARDELLTGKSPLSSNPWHRCAQIIYAGKYYE